MLKMTGIKIELISDINMHYFIEQGMRGGISHIANKYMTDYPFHTRLDLKRFN